MKPKKLQYDESGEYTAYVCLTFFLLILIPVTCYCWPSKTHGNIGYRCNCDKCYEKQLKIKSTRNKIKVLSCVLKIILIAAWVICFIYFYTVFQTEHTDVVFDPYDILGVEKDASKEEIRKAYKRLSLIFHPDKSTGNEKEFVKITKAYNIFTNNESRYNWEKYGNPDGEISPVFGKIALPYWIVEKEYSFWVLSSYGITFMITLPAAVGIWWSKSKRYSYHVLLITTGLYTHMLKKTKMIHIKRLIMILSASLEFEKHNNNKIKERTSDDMIELENVSKTLTTLGGKTQEWPFYHPYSLKARVLIHSHLTRITFKKEILNEDLRYVISKCPLLLGEMVNIVTHCLLTEHERKTSLQTLENIMKLSQMIIQAQWESKGPLLQLPYITEEDTKYMYINNKRIRTISQLLKYPKTKIRKLFKTLSEEHFDDIITVAEGMPYIEVTVECKVLDEEKSKANVYTTGSVVTAMIKLTRHQLKDKTTAEELREEDDEKDEIESERKVFGYKKNKRNAKPIKKIKKPQPKLKNTEEKHIPENDTDDESIKDTETDEFWEKVESKITNIKTTKRQVLSHPVHCPYFPNEKQEYWWVYVVNTKETKLLTPATFVTGLIEEETLFLQFPTPNKEGKFHIAVCVRSDSYMGTDQVHEMVLDVKKGDHTFETIKFSSSESENEVESSSSNNDDLTTDSE